MFINLASWWPPLVVLVFSIIFLVIIVRFSGVDEYGQPIKQHKPKEETPKERLISWISGIIVFILTILFLILILFLLADDLAIASINCVNCTLIN